MNFIISNGGECVKKYNVFSVIINKELQIFRNSFPTFALVTRIYDLGWGENYKNFKEKFTAIPY